MLTLAASKDGEPIAAREIAQKQKLSLKYLEGLLGSLKAAGLVSSKQGVRGGYFLNKRPEEITLYEILVSLGERLDIVACTADPGICDQSPSCATREVWGQIKEAVLDILCQTTLADLQKRSAYLESRQT
jgi:Rrf2 family protein